MRIKFGVALASGKLPQCSMVNNALVYEFNVTLTSPSAPSFSLKVPVVANCKEWGSSYTYTFLDFDGSVQYAAAKVKASCCHSLF